MSFWSTDEHGRFAVRDDDTIIAYVETQALASKIVNGLNHYCIPTPCVKCGPDRHLSASVCMGHHIQAVMLERRAQGGTAPNIAGIIGEDGGCIIARIIPEP